MLDLKISMHKICIPIIIFLPVMLDLSSGIAFNISVADLFLPIAILFLMSNYLYSTSKSIPILYILIICIVLILNLLKISLMYDLGSIINGTKNIFKIGINIAYFIVFVYLFKIKGEKYEHIFIKTWSYTSVFISTLGILGVILFSMGIENRWSFYYRAISTFNDPNLFATYLFISIGIGGIYNYKSKKKIFGFNLFINIIAIIFTSSRGAIITIVGSILFIILINLVNREFKNIKNILICIWAGSMLFVLSYLIIRSFVDVDILSSTTNRLLNMGDSIKGDSRLVQWKSAINIWLRHPILGAGMGKFIDIGIEMGFTNYKILAHNTYLNFLAELGISGLIAFMWFPFMLFVKIIKNSINRIDNQIIIFSMTSVFISCMSLNLENFRCMWVFFAYCFYYCFKNSSKV